MKTRPKKEKMMFVESRSSINKHRVYKGLDTNESFSWHTVFLNLWPLATEWTNHMQSPEKECWAWGSNERQIVKSQQKECSVGDHTCWTKRRKGRRSPASMSMEGRDPTTSQYSKYRSNNSATTHNTPSIPRCAHYISNVLPQANQLPVWELF